MVFHDHFKNHILPEQIHILNVAFLVPDMQPNLLTAAQPLGPAIHDAEC